MTASGLMNGEGGGGGGNGNILRLDCGDGGANEFISKKPLN